MPTRNKRVAPWLTLSVAQGNAIQLGGLLGAAALAWYAGREGAGGKRGARWIIVASRLLAYFCEHAFSHWLVGRALGIRFTGYGLHGTSHPHLYPPGARFLFSHLPLLSARVDLASLRAASSTERAALYAAGTVGTVLVRPRDPGLRGMARRLGRARDARRLRRRDERVRGSQRGFASWWRPDPRVAGAAEALGVGVA